MRLLYLLWPHLPLRLARARLEAGGATSGSWPTGPIVLGGQPWTDGIVLDADPLARALGVRRGIPLGSAHRQAPEAVFLDPTPDEDRAAVEAACERLAGFSPGIAGTSDVADPAFGRLIVHADGLVRLWGAEERLVARINEALAPVIPGPPLAGIAGTGFAAGVASAYAEPGGPPTLIPPGDDERFLAPYPARLLTKDPDIRARLGRFGLRTIGAVAELPRSSLVARFGDEGARLHARAHGEETERFRPRKTPERMALGLPLDPPAEGLDALRFVLRRLSAALADQLAARGQAAGMARLAVTHDLAFARRGTPQMLRFEQRFPEPTADAEAIERLLYARLEGAPPPAAVARLELELGLVEAARGQQLPLFTPQAARGARLEWQLARLAIAFGADRVRRVEVGDTDAPLAEARWTWRPVAGVEVTGAADAARAGGDAERHGGARAGGRVAGAARAGGDRADAGGRGTGDRPAARAGGDGANAERHGGARAGARPAPAGAARAGGDWARARTVVGGESAPATVAAGYGAGALGRSAGRELGAHGPSGSAR